MKFLLLIFAFSFNAMAKVTIDNSCVNDPSIKGPSKEQMQRRYEQNLAEASKRIFWCEHKYPEIRQYTREWRYISQDITIVCKKDDGGRHLAVFGYLLDPLLHLWQGTITIYTDELKKILTTDQSKNNKAMTSIIHEIFHGTSANNNHTNRRINE